LLIFCSSLCHYFGLQGILFALEKLGSTCLINLTPKEFRFYLTSEFTQGEQMFVEMPVESLCETYRIESKSNNEIPFLVHIPNLARAIKSAESAERVVVKLTKKGDQPFLTFEMKTVNMNITQEVPVQIQLAQKVKESAEPDLPNPNVKFRMPDPKMLRGVVERMRKLSGEITISATSHGEVCFRVANDSVNIETHFKSLMLRDDDAKGPAIQCHAMMDINKLWRALHCRSLLATHFIGCIVDPTAFVLYILLDHNMGTVTYYIPLITE
jgi:Hus1-like protein